MPTSNKSFPWLLNSQVWASFFRLIIALYGSVIIFYQISDVYPLRKQKLSIHDIGSDLASLGAQAAIWIVLVFNDIFMLTFDFKRTNTYAGCVAIQSLVSFSTVIITMTSLTGQVGWDYSDLPQEESGSSLSNEDRVYLFSIPTLMGLLLSFCLWWVVHWPPVWFICRSRSLQVNYWKCNTKDLLLGIEYEATPKLSFTGRPRVPSNQVQKGIHVSGNMIRHFLTRAVFRRVNSVETRIYALIQNVFALVSMAVLIFRTVVAFQTAENGIGTKMFVDSCAPDGGELYQNHFFEFLTPAKPPFISIDMTVRRGYDDSFRNCTWEGSMFGELATCPEAGYYRGFPLAIETPVFNIAVSNSLNLTHFIYQGNLPSIWISNRNQTFYPAETNHTFEPFAGCVTCLYSPPWKPRLGYHVEAEVHLITRRFLVSSMIRDIIFNSEPKYVDVSLYRIVETSATPLINLNSESLNSTSGLYLGTIATATLYATLAPAHNDLRDRSAFQSLGTYYGPQSDKAMCTFIKDYRESTVFDAVGSIGGFFALLQAAHVLIFGKPMLWGLFGAKLITPFGLLGVCSSKRFRNRLRNQYHSQNVSGDSEPFRTGMFLRDYVIEFGPADFELESPGGAIPNNPVATSHSNQGGG